MWSAASLSSAQWPLCNRQNLPNTCRSWAGIFSPTWSQLKSLLSESPETGSHGCHSLWPHSAVGPSLWLPCAVPGCLAPCTLTPAAQPSAWNERRGREQEHSGRAGTFLSPRLLGPILLLRHISLCAGWESTPASRSEDKGAASLCPAPRVLRLAVSTDLCDLMPGMKVPTSEQEDV